jgi:hypothetical protein
MPIIISNGTITDIDVELLRAILGETMTSTVELVDLLVR